MSCDRTRELDLAAFAVGRHDSRRGADRAGFRAHYPRCAECSHEVAAWSGFLDALRGNPETTGDAHPEPARLLAFASEPASLAPVLRGSVGSHLARCAACRSELAVLRGFDFSRLAPAPSPAADRPLRERVRSALASWVASACAPLPRPALALGVLALLLLPAGFVLWRVIASGADGPRQSPRVARAAPVEPVPPVAPIPPAPSVAPEQVALEAPAPPPATPPRVEAPREQPREPIVAAREAPSEPEPAPPPEPIRIAALVPPQPPLYDPALALGFGTDALRVTSVIRAGRSELPSVQALGPEQVGVTSEAAPVLYWHLSAPSPVPVELVLAADDAVEPLLETTLAPPVRAGLQTLDLAARGIELAPGVTYRWYVSLVPDAERRDADRVSGVAIRRVPADPELAERLAAAPAAERAHVLAAAGYWLDAFATLSRWIDDDPDAATLRRHRQALLEQVQLGDTLAGEAVAERTL